MTKISRAAKNAGIEPVREVFYYVASVAAILALVLLLSSCVSAFRERPAGFTAVSKQETAVNVATEPDGSISSIYMEVPKGAPPVPKHWQADTFGATLDGRPFALIYPVPETHY